VTAHPVEDAYPLAALQAGMLFHSLYGERVATYHDVLTLTLEGRFDRAALQAAVDAVVRRHPVLRTSFDLTDYSEPIQLVHRDAPLPVAVHDHRGRPAADAVAAVAEWAAEEQFRPYRLDRPPLLRITVHLLTGDRFVLGISFHHAILDGWSVASLSTELIGRYNALLAGDEPPPAPVPDTFADFIAAERAAIGSPETAAYWRDLLADAPAGRLPRMPGYLMGGQGVSEHAGGDLPARLCEELRMVAARLRVPLRSVLLAAHMRVLALVTGDPDVLTGTVANGRPETVTGTDVLGLFLNLVPMRLRADRPSWATLIADVHDQYVRSLPHRRYPLFEIQRLVDRSPLVDTSFDYRDFHVYGALAAQDAVQLADSHHLETTDVPFAAAFGRSADRLTLTLSYDGAQFPAEQVAAIREYYLAVLRRIAADPDADPRPSVPLLSADLARIARWNASKLATTADGATLALHALVAERADRCPDAVAVVEPDGTVTTYAQLWQRGSALATRLRARGIGPESVVAVAVPRSAGTVVAVLGVLAARGTVLPLDTDHPDHRLREIVESAGAAALVTRADLASRYATLVEPVPIIELGGTGVEVGDGGDAAVPEAVDPEAVDPEAVDPDALAFVLFTSGSTGRPKGVLLTHQAAAAYALGQAERMGLHAGSRVAQRSPLSVDAAVFELAVAFSVGAALVVMPTETVADPDAFAAACQQGAITVMVLVPSLIAPHVEAGTFTRCPTLEVVASVGEALPRALAEAFAKGSPARLYNLYGPTEAGIGLTSYLVEDTAADGGTVPIGGPTDGVQLYVLDRSGQQVPVGTPGDLVAGGTQLARGYLGQPAATGEAFVPDHLSGRPGARLYRTGDIARWLPTGVLEYLGRRDGQLKVRGVRVEPGEIEARLLEHPQVRHAVVQLYRVADREILAAHVVWTGTGPVAEELRAFLVDRLPRALIPTSYRAVDEIPTLAGGKVDRAALPPPVPDRAGYVSPRDHVEARLVSRFEEVLGVPAVGLFDDFFDLGGHSLHALRLTMLLRHDFDREVPVAALLAGPTVAQLATRLRAPDNLAPRVDLVAFRDSGDRPPLFLMHPLGGQIFRYQKMARALGGDQPVYGIPARGFADGEQPHETLAAMADDYAGYIRRRYPHGPYLVGGACVGGNIALEVARRLRHAGEEVPLVFAFWSHADTPVSPDQTDDATLMMYALAGSPFQFDRADFAGLSADERLLAIVSGAAREGRLNPAATDIEQARRILRVYRANANALSGNRHEPYDGDVVLLKPVEAQDFPFEDDFRWREVVGNRLRILPIPGRQDNFADEPQATEVATILKGLIDSVIDRT
jgi:amino acid adenylation domain-containing protein